MIHEHLSTIVFSAIGLWLVGGLIYNIKEWLQKHKANPSSTNS